MERILIVEDDRAIISSLAHFLQSEGYLTDTVSGQQEAEACLDDAAPDLILLDISIENGDGYSLCRLAKKKNFPVIFLTASDDEPSVVRGLDMDADDYITKPFRPRELLSRIRSVLRRYEAPDKIEVEDLKIYPEQGIVLRQDREVPLSALEFRLLNIFLNNRGILLSRNRLIDEIWDIGGDFVNDNTLTVYIKRLRQKLEADPQNPRIIQTVRGLGYRMN
ncbi:response regulator transcription factor [Peptoniphilaceae bacterium SGI.137]|nr:response regulator transcription factor [Peptoniphilaceae bacterium]MDY5842017.1 response regulator transcription factor [Peptoniphilaceae bacterium]